MNYTTELALAEAAARRAGAHLANTIHGPKTVLDNSGHDIKLQADRDAEAIILEMLRDSPCPVLSEEIGEVGVVEMDAPAWIVDPLDGTWNYKRALPMCAVSIALMRGETPLLGVVYDFNRDELFSGVPGEGATLNGAPIHVSDERVPERAALATGFPSAGDFSTGALTEFILAAQRFKKVRLLGSAALSLAYVACGRVDVYAEDEIMHWDVAGGAALVLAAGGVVDTAPGTKGRWSRRVRAAANREVLAL